MNNNTTVPLPRLLEVKQHLDVKNVASPRLCTTEKDQGRPQVPCVREMDATCCIHWASNLIILASDLVMLASNLLILASDLERVHNKPANLAATLGSRHKVPVHGANPLRLLVQVFERVWRRTTCLVPHGGPLRQPRKLPRQAWGFWIRGALKLSLTRHIRVSSKLATSGKRAAQYLGLRAARLGVPVLVLH